MKTLIVCASRYGSTLEIARWISERLPWETVEVYPVENAPNPDEFELIFLGGGVYTEKITKEIVEYAKKNFEVLKDKKVVLFAVCLDTKGFYLRGNFYGGWRYLEPLLEVFKSHPPLYAGVLSGEINPKKLNQKDYQALMHFYNKILKRNITQVPYITKMNKAEVWEFVERVLARLEGRL